MNLAYKYPTIFWDCACLINDAGGNEDEDEDEEAAEETKVETPYYDEMEEFNEEEDEEESSYDEDDGANGYPATIIVTKDGRKKKKLKTTNYGKVASAIGKMSSTGVKIVPPDINESKYTFSPDVELNAIRYGLSGITRVGAELVKAIIDNRPYTSLEEFLSKVKVNKPQMINLIKAGAFDQIGDYSNRGCIMHEYIGMISGAKKRITLQNLKMLIDFGLIPDEYDLQRRVFNFNKYLKKSKEEDYYLLDEIAFNFYSANFDIDKLVPNGDNFKIKQTIWDNIYQHHMDIIRPYVKKHNEELLQQVNDQLMKDMWDKYCQGNYSHWEMQAISCYIHQHELTNVNYSQYGLTNFFKLSETPTIERYIPIKGKQVPIFRLERIAGTVLDRDKSKKLVTLLTREGVVTVKIYGGVFQEYDKQLSVRGADGKKHVVEKSMFSRGNLIIVTGIRQDDSFLAKTYSKTPWHKVEQIIQVYDYADLDIRHERTQIEE